MKGNGPSVISAESAFFSQYKENEDKKKTEIVNYHNEWLQAAKIYLLRAGRINVDGDTP
jgi:hypothetical protein